MEMPALFSFFTDPVLRGPTIASMLMCLSAGLVGVLVFLRKESLVGEVLSHASYPGVIIGVIAVGLLALEVESPVFPFFLLGGAASSALLALWLIHVLEKRFRVFSDTALCFVLASFFGVGVTMASQVQFSYTSLYLRIQAYLYGQAATMTDVHILIYGLLAFMICLLVLLFYKEFQSITFDRQFAKSLGISVYAIEALLFFIVVLAVVIGIRSVGVVLMSAMLIAPPVAARQFTNKLSTLFALSALFGLISGFLGNYLSVRLNIAMTQQASYSRLIIPTGPLIVLVSAIFSLLALLFAPKRGLLVRWTRAARFRYRCAYENILKLIWRIDPEGEIAYSQIGTYQALSYFYLSFLLWRMQKNGWIKEAKKDHYRLTSDGKHRAAKIVRLHRLWEVYLVGYLGVERERVHLSAEEMEHVITPDLEEKLTLLLKNPQKDPHFQFIPPQERTGAL